MLYRNNGEWDICKHKVKYIQHGEEIEQYVGAEGKQWWGEFAEKWDHTEIIEFIDVVDNEEQLARLQEVKGIPDGFSEVCSNYVKDGSFLDEIEHELRNLQLEKLNIQLGTEISEIEINEIITNVQINDIEIQLLELQIGGI